MLGSPSASLNKGEQTKIKRIGNLYGVYKLVGEVWQLKRSFYSSHQARRYQQGFKRNRTNK